ncbi:hypothetical protein [Sphingopyxis sp. R3-92]
MAEKSHQTRPSAPLPVSSGGIGREIIAPRRSFSFIETKLQKGS